MLVSMCIKSFDFYAQVRYPSESKKCKGGMFTVLETLKQVCCRRQLEGMLSHMDDSTFTEEQYECLDFKRFCRSILIKKGEKVMV
jgi:hypothetical protein